MKITRYRITAMNPEIQCETQTWLIAASSHRSAWAKFITQYCGVLKPTPSEYRVQFESYE